MEMNIQKKNIYYLMEKNKKQLKEQLKIKMEMILQKRLQLMKEEIKLQKDKKFIKMQMEMK